MNRLSPEWRAASVPLEEAALTVADAGGAGTAFPETGRPVKRVSPDTESVSLLDLEEPPCAFPPLASADGAEAVSEGTGRFVKRLSPESEVVSLPGDKALLEASPPADINAWDAESVLEEAERLVKRVFSELESASLSEGETLREVTPPVTADV